MNQADIKNKADIQLLRYRGESNRWGLREYINAHKKLHQVQTEFHDDYGFNEFTNCEKVLFQSKLMFMTCLFLISRATPMVLVPTSSWRS